MDTELLKILVNFRVVQGLMEEAARELKELADQIEKYVKEEKND